MPKKIITKESAAWREVARRIADGKLDHGICFMFDALAREDKITPGARFRMAERIRDAKEEKEALGEGGGAYLWPAGECADERELYCLFMAELAEDEGQ